MYYLKWTKKEIQDSPFEIIYTEVDDNGKVLREMGINHNEVFHRAPSPLDPYGLFDLQRIDTQGLKSNITKEYFEEYWAQK